MTPQLILAIASLLAEALAAGVSINDILAKSKATGRVPEDVWAKIIAEIIDAEAGWKGA